MQVALVRFTLVVFLWALLIGCSGEQKTPATTNDPDSDSITGTVTKIDDHVPVDGGVVLELTLEGGRKEAAFLPSFFTAPPPPPAADQVYQVILQISIGDRVRAEGKRTSNGIQLEELTILNDR